MLSEPARGTRPRRLHLGLGAILLFAWAVRAAAQTSETVEGLGPRNGRWQLEYVGQFGNARGTPDKRQHSGQSFYGVMDWLALGGETQLSYRSGPLVKQDRLYFDYDSAIAIARFSDPERDPIGLGLWVQAGLDVSDGELARIEARLIAEKRTPRWWGQANLMLRRVNEGKQEGRIGCLRSSGKVRVEHLHMGRCRSVRPGARAWWLRPRSPRQSSIFGA